MERQHWIFKWKKVSNRRLHADRSRRTGVDSFFDHLQFCFRGLERVFGSLRDAGRIDQLDIRLLADLKQLRFDSDTVCGQDTNRRVDLYGDLLLNASRIRQFR